MNSIVAHIFRKLGERIGGRTCAELIAEEIVHAALGGDLKACKLIILAGDRYDPALQSLDDDEDDA
jgi:hypothetical protein